MSGLKSSPPSTAPSSSPGYPRTITFSGAKRPAAPKASRKSVGKSGLKTSRKASGLRGKRA